MEKETFDLVKWIEEGHELITRDGYPAFVLKTDAKGAYPLLGYWSDEEKDHPACWDTNGSHYPDLEDAWDIFPKRKIIKMAVLLKPTFLGVPPFEIASFHPTKEEAEEAFSKIKSALASSWRIGKLTWEE